MNLRTAGPTIALILLAIFATAFAFINYNNSVKIWPLQSLHPLTYVIGIALLLGACVGGLLTHLIHYKRAARIGETGGDPTLIATPGNSKNVNR